MFFVYSVSPLVNEFPVVENVKSSEELLQDTLFGQNKWWQLRGY